MSEISTDFGEGIISLGRDDAFFLDTNIIVSFLYENDDRHFATYNFITYLLLNDILLCISEITVSETINTLAKIYYIDDEYVRYVTEHGEPVNQKKKKEIMWRIGTSWYRKIVKTDETRLRHYNKLAVEKFKPFFNACLLITPNEQQLSDGMDLCTEIPLASPDALIINAALLAECTGIISLDKDLENVEEIEVYSTEVKNSDYDVLKMIELLGTKDFILETLGEDDFKSKFMLC